MSAKPIRVFVLGLGFALAAALSACQEEAPPPPAPLGLPFQPPAITLSTSLVQDAVVFQDHMTVEATINPNFTGPADVSLAVARSASIAPERLTRGEIAFAAIAALQDPNFVANVRAFASNTDARQAMADRLRSDPDYVVALGGSDTAAGLAMGAIDDLADRGRRDGLALRQASYDVQHQAWSKLAVIDRPQRLTNVKNAALASTAAPMADVQRLAAAAAGTAQIPLQAPAAPPPYSPVIVRGLAVAALAALGEAGDENLVAMDPLLQDSRAVTCLNTANLNLYQCFAVARPNYEDMFCLGQYAVMDTAECVATAAATPKLETEPPAASAAAPAPAPIPVPAPKRKRH